MDNRTALLPHKLGKSYGDPTGQVVKQVIGTRIRNLRHLVETLRKITDLYVEFEFHEKYVEALVFDRKEVLAAMDDSEAPRGQKRSARSASRLISPFCLKVCKQ
jgi:hypothetical protein